MKRYGKTIGFLGLTWILLNGASCYKYSDLSERFYNGFMRYYMFSPENFPQGRIKKYLKDPRAVQSISVYDQFSTLGHLAVLRLNQGLIYSLIEMLGDRCVFDEESRQQLFYNYVNDLGLYYVYYVFIETKSTENEDHFGKTDSPWSIQLDLTTSCGEVISVAPVHIETGSLQEEAEAKYLLGIDTERFFLAKLYKVKFIKLNQAESAFSSGIVKEDLHFKIGVSQNASVSFSLEADGEREEGSFDDFDNESWQDRIELAMKEDDSLLGSNPIKNLFHMVTIV